MLHIAGLQAVVDREFPSVVRHFTNIGAWHGGSENTGLQGFHEDVLGALGVVIKGDVQCIVQERSIETYIESVGTFPSQVLQSEVKPGTGYGLIVISIGGRANAIAGIAIVVAYSLTTQNTV